jgi:geranylgeranyl diphosphate synthase type I
MAEALPVIEQDLHTVLETPDGSPPQFYRMLHYHMGWIDSSGNLVASQAGKRLRPALCLMAAKAVAGSYHKARAAAVAVELLHNFSLMHDDIEDESPIRHGRSTVWNLWGIEQAINAGDALYALAHLAIPRLAPADIPAALIAQMLATLDETSLEVTRGQHLDMSFATRESVSVEDYLGMIGGKTAALIGASAELGAASAGAGAETQEHYRQFGRNLGMAFQIMDDILDIWGAPETTGKQAAVDIYHRKKSLPVVFGLEKGVELRHLYAASQPFDQDDVARVIAQLDDFGARAYAEEQAERYSNLTIQHLESASPQQEAGQALMELVQQLLRRDR